jgi:hypothetical protein
LIIKVTESSVLTAGYLHPRMVERLTHPDSLSSRPIKEAARFPTRGVEESCCLWFLSFLEDSEHYFKKGAMGHQSLS